MKKGSMTVFFALSLSMIIVLVCASIESVKMMCARTQIANSADVGMYSLFAQYDRYLLDRYGLFYLDASYGTDGLQLGRAYRTVEEYMGPILDQGHLDLTIASGGITSYVLAADHNGQPFRDQVVAYMRDMPGSQGIPYLAESLREKCEKIRGFQEYRQHIIGQDILAVYDGEMAWAGNASAQVEMGEQETEQQEQKAPVQNPIEAIRELRNMDILELVIPDQASISDREIDTGQAVSHRVLQEGMGVLQPLTVQDPAMEKVLFQEYMMQNCGTYTAPAEGGGLRYQVEYVIGRSGSDRENLKMIAERLLEIREGANLALLYTDPEKRAQSAALAEAIASEFLVPPAAEVIENALLLCWAFGESVLDVKALFDGGEVPLTKSPADWDLSLERLPGLLTECSVERPQGGAQGMDPMDHADHLRALLFMGEEDSVVTGCMDMIEADIRGQQGREGFCMDHCLGAMEIEMDVEAGGRKLYTVRHQYGYDQ